MRFGWVKTVWRRWAAGPFVRTPGTNVVPIILSTLSKTVAAVVEEDGQSGGPRSGGAESCRTGAVGGGAESCRTGAVGVGAEVRSRVGPDRIVAGGPRSGVVSDHTCMLRHGHGRI